MLSKVGDTVTYSYTITNTSSEDSPNLILDSVTDAGDNFNGAGLGDLTATAAANGCSTLAFEGSCSFDVDYIVQEGDDDPLNNTVTVHYHPDGFQNDITASDSHEVDLFQPSIEVTKTGDTLSKVGDDVSYSVLIENTSSAGSPALWFDLIDDSLQGNLTNAANYDSSTCGASLAAGASCQIDYTYTVQSGDADPLLNTITVESHPFSFPNDIDDSDSWEVNLFQPSIEVTKTGDTLSKVGDDVSYSVTIENTSSADSPALVFDKIEDSLQGDLTNAADYDSSTCGASLAASASCVIEYTYTVQGGDPDPLLNKVTVESHPDGYPNDIDDSDGHSVNLFQPSINVTKTGDTLSKVGDDVSYSVTIENTSSADSPALVFDLISDSLQGDLTNAANYDSSTCGASLAAQASCLIEYTYTVQGGDPDPLLNTVSVESHPNGFTNDIDDSDGHSVNLFQPSINVTKTGDTYSKAGDSVSYSVTIENTSSTDSPALVFDLISDSLQGDLTNAANYDSSTCGASLAAGTSCQIDYSYTVQGGDPDPLLNTVTVETHPDGFTNDIDGSDGHSVDLIHPSFTVAKVCDAEPVSPQGPANFTVTIANTGDVPLDITADDGIGSFTLAAGASQNFSVSLPGPFTPGGTADNMVTASWTLPEIYGLSNTDEASASDSCDVSEPEFETAYALGDDAACFTDLGAGTWGWVNGNGATSILPGTYEWPVWAGAAHCDTSNGTLVGTVEVEYDGTDVFVTWHIDSPNILGDTHVYAGLSQVPSGGFSPGQWEIESPFGGEAIYIILHAVVGIP